MHVGWPGNIEITHQKCQKVISGLNRGVVSRVFSYWPSLWWYSWSNFFLVHWHHTPHNNAIIDFPFFGAQVHILKTNIEYLLCPWLPCFWKTIQSHFLFWNQVKHVSKLHYLSIPRSEPNICFREMNISASEWLHAQRGVTKMPRAIKITKTIPFSFWCLIFR